MNMSNRALALNGVAILTAVIGMGALVRSMFVAEHVPPCPERYEKGVMFSVERRPGELAGGPELQARISNRDWGVLENAQGVTLANAPVKNGLEVRIPKGGFASGDGGAVKGGMSFPWAPRSLGRTEAACLSYQIWLPADFDFGRGGRLPAIVGGRTSDLDPETKGALISRLIWKEGGAAEVMTTFSGEGQPGIHPYGRGKLTLARGKWVAIEQEVILNAPGERKGVLRLWVDGELLIDRRDVQFRESADQLLTGINADVVYGNREPGSAARKATLVRLTPFELRWR